MYPLLAKELNKSRTYPLIYQSFEGSHFLDKIVDIDQKPIGRTPRSNPATYTGLFTFIRDLFQNCQNQKLEVTNQEGFHLMLREVDVNHV